MRNIPEEYKDSPAGKALAKAQAEFLKASQELLDANLIARAENYIHTDKVENKAGSLGEAEQRMKLAEAAFDQLTGGPEPVPLTKRVIRKVRQSFSLGEQLEVIRLLERECAKNLPFSENDTPEDTERIRLAVLKVAGGSESELRKQIDLAKIDWREVIDVAEYPEASSVGLLEYSKLDEDSRQAIQRRDREQYIAWLGEPRMTSLLDRVLKRIWPRARKT